MAKAKRTGNSHKGYYAMYKSGKKWHTNRIKKLQRALKRNPGNAEQINKAIANAEYRRKTPSSPTWSASKINGAKLFKAFQGRVPKSFINNVSPKKGEEAEYWADINSCKWKLDKAKPDNSMFALGTRARTKL